MKPTENNPAAYPVPAASETEGMTLADNIAIQAMASLLANPPTGTKNRVTPWTYDDHGHVVWNILNGPEQVARMSYQMAAAMINERKKVTL